MNNNLRILYNTIILYVRIIVCSGLSLWTIPLALSALGQSDFGLYNLIAGVLSMLAFVSSSMAIASQRYISVSIGSHDVTRINMAYNISLRLHFLLAIFVIILFEIVYPFLFNGMLNIQPERIKTAQLLYQIMMISTVSTIVSVPFDSIMFAHENMVVPSLIAILDAINKLVVVVFISTLDIDRLLIYGIGLTFITLLNVFLKYLFVKFKYRQYYFSIDSFDKSLFQEMFAYAGWSSVGSLSQLGRNQGVALVLNFFCGTVVNAAYGIANHINAVLLSFTGSIQTAISPQLMQREGAKDRKGMLSMSLVLIKISTTIFNLIAVPLILEMPYILNIWLKDVPENTISFARLILLFQLLYQYSSGIALSIDAVGKIKEYRLAVSSALLLNIPLIYILLKASVQIRFVLLTFTFVECICLCVRIYFAKKKVEYDVKYFITKLMIPSLLIIIVASFTCFFINKFVCEGVERLIFTTIISCSIILIGSFFFVLTKEERTYVLNRINSII